MKKMFKIKQIGAGAALAALMMAGAWLTTACSSDEAIVDEKNTPADNGIVKFTATLAPKNDASGTRAITPGTDSNSKEILNVAWKKDEEIAVYYLKNDGTHATAKAIVQSIDPTTHVATIATVDGHHIENPQNNSTAEFIYPYSLATNDGKIDNSKLRNQQTGELTYSGSGDDNSISKNYDAATGSGTIVVSGATASVSDHVKMKNQCCIGKFNIVIPNPSAEATHYNVTIAFTGGITYNLSMVPKDRINSLYVAMLPVTTATTATITVEEMKSSDGGVTGNMIIYYSKDFTGVKLEAGKFYRSISINYPPRITGDYHSTITIPDGGTVILYGVNIDVSTGPGIKCEGNATIILEGNNIVKGIQAGPAGTTLTIRGNGNLTANGGSDAAGIGGGFDECGNITISGGTVTANGGSNAAGIGSGFDECGNITISGGTVTATGGENAAGIGSGMRGTCGDITIYNTVTKVTATKGKNAPYSIGKSENAKCGEINIGGISYYSDHFQNNGASYLATSPLVYQPSH